MIIIIIYMQSHPLLSVVGPVGAGKVRFTKHCSVHVLRTSLQSTLLQCVLGELVPKAGSLINIQGTVSYAAQEPWLFSDTLRENILFGKAYDAEWYNTVITACALDKVCTVLII